MGTELTVNVGWYVFSLVCKPEMAEIFNALFVISGWNVFKDVCKPETSDIETEFVVNNGWYLFNWVCNPDISEIVKPDAIPFIVALLQIKFPDGSTEKALLDRVPVNWGLLKFNLVFNCNNNEAAILCSVPDKSCSANASLSSVSKLSGALSINARIKASTSDFEYTDMLEPDCIYICINTWLKDAMGVVPAYPTATNASLMDAVVDVLLFVNFNWKGNKLEAENEYNSNNLLLKFVFKSTNNK